jgi:hypothetical protein
VADSRLCGQVIVAMSREAPSNALINWMVFKCLEKVGGHHQPVHRNIRTARQGRLCQAHGNPDQLLTEESGL